MDKNIAELEGLTDTKQSAEIEFDIEVTSLDGLEDAVCACKSSDDNPYQGGV